MPALPPRERCQICSLGSWPQTAVASLGMVMFCSGASCYHLFDTSATHTDVTVHPSSLLHSTFRFCARPRKHLRKPVKNSVLSELMFLGLQLVSGFSLQPETEILCQVHIWIAVRHLMTPKCRCLNSLDIINQNECHFHAPNNKSYKSMFATWIKDVMGLLRNISTGLSAKILRHHQFTTPKSTFYYYFF